MSVAYGNGMFVAVAQGDADKNIMTSPDGVTWTTRSGGGATSWNNVKFENNLFVAVGQGGTNQVSTSPDGITWTGRSSIAGSVWKSVTYGNGTFVAISQGNSGADPAPTKVLTSPDGITWTAGTEGPVGINFYDVAFGNGVFAAVEFSNGTDVNLVATSPDPVSPTTTSTTIATSTTLPAVTIASRLCVSRLSKGWPVFREWNILNCARLRVKSGQRLTYEVEKGYESVCAVSGSGVARKGAGFCQVSIRIYQGKRVAAVGRILIASTR